MPKRISQGRRDKLRIIRCLRGVQVALVKLRADLDDNARSSHITPADGNLFADLGFPPREAGRLVAKADAEIRARTEERDNVSDEELVASIKNVADKDRGP